MVSSLEEAELRDTRRLFVYGDGAREGVASALLVLIGGTVLFNLFAGAWVPLSAQIWITVTAAVVVGGAVGWVTGGRAKRRRAQELAEQRESLAAERERQLAEFRAAKAAAARNG